jgi:type II secretory pathway pseudopilin PulG
MLLFLMLAVAVLMITMLGVARNYRRSIVRDREVEMIHRGEGYERAVKRYYRKFGNYPPSIEALENTNKVRFLRKRYKDPMSVDGAWKLVHVGDVVLKVGGGVMPTQPTSGGAPGTSGTTPPASTDGSTPGSNTSGSNDPTQGLGGTTGGTIGGTTGGTTGGDTGGSGPAGSSGDGNNPILGGGPVIGVVSRQKGQGIHAFGDKTKYTEWFFIYDPSQDRGQLLVGAYNPNMFLGASTSGLNQPPNGAGSGSTGTGGAPGAPTAPNANPPAAPPQPTSPTPPSQ